MAELTQLSLLEAAELIHRGELSPLALTRAHIDRIHKIDPLINSYIHLMADQALADAHQAEIEIAQQGARSLLHGIPLALKDLYETKDAPTTAASKLFADYIPAEDAFVVKKLRAAGAVILGKLNMHEIALGVTNVSSHFGPVHNPWNRERISGGSSGGSAAALAAGLCMGSLGSDTGGSIRIPSSFCGTVGLKPTYGRVSLRGVIPLSWNLDHAGPMARRVKDVAVLLQAIAGYDSQDPYSANVPTDDYLDHIDAGVQGWRIAMASNGFFTDVTDPEVLAMVRAAKVVFIELGARVEDVEFHQGREAARANGLMTTSDAAAFHRQRLEDRPEDFTEDVRTRLLSGAAYTSTEYVLARRAQTLLRYRFERFFDEYDVLLTPTTAISATPIEGPDGVQQAPVLTRYTAPFNLTGLPALSVPCGFSVEGLPVGLQIVTRSWGEAKLLQAAFAYEQATDWHTRQPALTGTDD